MNRENLKTSFVYVNKDTKSVSGDTYADSVINSIAIVTGKTWETVYQELINVSQKLCLMPFSLKCLQELLAENHFLRVFVARRNLSLNDVLEMVTEINKEFKMVVVRQRDEYNSNMFAVVPEKDRFGKEVFKAKGKEFNASYYISEIWLYRPDIENMKDRADTSHYVKKAQRYIAPEEQEFFHYSNLNANGFIIGDCLVRAFANSLEITWQEAVDRLGKDGVHITQINREVNFDKALKAEGFKRQSRIIHDGHLLTGKDFCKYISKVYRHGERILAYSGRKHAVAIIPFVNDKGKYQYRIVDSWDSTHRKIHAFYVKPSEETVAEKEHPETCLRLGAMVQHPIFGYGYIEKIRGTGIMCMADTMFDDGVRKRLSAQWIFENCKVIQ